ncbi:MAG: ribbon-helix-helix protein, CopG family [Micropruina sp.]|nr:ribbon-helix-helix protein, CopG family [Micropruina sp.]
MAEKYTIGPDIDLDTEEVLLPSGHRYSNADAEADSEYFASRPGRPSLARGVSPQVSFRVPRDVKDELASLSQAEGRPEAQVARQALLEYLARHRGA